MKVELTNKLESFEKEPVFYFRVIVSILGLVFIWRGTWNLLDRYLFPGQPLFSNALSVFLGYALVVFFADFDAISCPDL